MIPNATRFTRGELNVLHRAEDATRTASALRQVGSTIALVPTMGALHEGHLELVRRAGRIPNAVVAVSIFVNPLQFGPGEDYETYPRRLDDDLEALRRAGVELVFTPEVTELYPEGASVTVDPGPLGEQLEGEHRPGHFSGVLTVVAKLFQVMRPHYALFGEKDYQQLVLIKRMVRDLNMEPSVIGVPTVRERDGLALSSRNSYLDAEQREQAVVLSAALTAGAHAGVHGAEAVYEAARATLAAQPEVAVDYLELRGPELEPAPAEGSARLLIAARVGSTRLIDNVGLVLGTPPDTDPGG
ncbi:pantoate--beta-alanine ligase [Haloechinothrix sp. LS1_15]|uniref:pantoate--beta-alanine ligase n=1 Tax=Haloechinothrix sp. LS1_15 TaxID=2652248 RepID=UPI00294798DD|nr:pantoate--beta-alanine ligase [Haloechinothrix sp. LS1_15]MDV6011430.1 pantoate--beta-alanine ligase [Haloechinothrix sp. LS1_15]